MVMGKVTKHIVEVIYEKNSYKTFCTCNWANKYNTRALAISASHFHLSELFNASAGI